MEFSIALRVYEVGVSTEDAHSSILIDLIERGNWKNAPLLHESDPSLLDHVPTLFPELITAASSEGYSFLAQVGRARRCLAGVDTAEHLASELAHRKRGVSDGVYPIYLWLYPAEATGAAYFAADALRNGKSYARFLNIGVLITVDRSAMSIFVKTEVLARVQRWVEDSLTRIGLPIERWD